MTHFDDITAFHLKHGRPVSQRPQLLSHERMIHRLRLISSELAELAEAHDNGDIVEFADALADLNYVVVGTAVEAGIKFDGVGGVHKEVHRSNMTKDVDLENAGKIKKGPNFEKPNLVQSLAWQVLDAGIASHSDPRVCEELGRIAEEGMPPL